MSTDMEKNYVVIEHAGKLHLTVDPKLLPAFKMLINRGLNVWDKAPAEIKELGDIICEGRILQDYGSQDTSKS